MQVVKFIPHTFKRLGNNWHSHGRNQLNSFKNTKTLISYRNVALPIPMGAHQISRSINTGSK